MRLEKGRFSSLELLFIVAGLMQGSIYVSTYTFSNTPRDEWLALLVSWVIFLPFAFVYLKLSEKYPNDSLVGIHDKVYGSVAGKALSAAYCLYLIVSSAMNFRFPSAFLTANFMIATPVIAFAFFIVALCLYATSGGIESIAQLGIFNTVAVVSSLLLYLLLLIPKIELPHFFPMFDVPPKKFVQSVHIITSEYMGELFVLSSILPYVSDRSRISKNYLGGLMLGNLTFLLVAFLVTGVLGNEAAIFTGPLVETTRLVEVLNINARIEFVFMGFLIITAFFKCLILFYVTLLSISELLGLRSYKLFSVPLGLLVFSLVMLTNENGPSLALAGRNSWAFISLLMLMIIPLITFATALIRGRSEERGGER